MQISDITMGKTVLESIAEKKKTQRLSTASALTPNLQSSNDSFASDKKLSNEIARVNSVQKNFLKDNASLSGFNQLQEKVNNFETFAAGDKNYDSLSRELSAIINSTKHEGESIISYLSTNIKDEKSLYTFKTNLNNEIGTVRMKMNEERKTLASYLIQGENREAAGNFSSEKTLRSVTASLDRKNSENLFKGISNLSALLGMDK